MRISAKTHCALRILVQLASGSGWGHRVVGRDLAARQNINGPYLEQIMVGLKNAGLVDTVRGRRGGYMLAADPHDISLLRVIEAFEGEVDLAEPDREHGRRGAGRETAWANAAWQELTKVVRGAAEEATLAAVIERSAADLAYVI